MEECFTTCKNIFTTRDLSSHLLRKERTKFKFELRITRIQTTKRQ